MKITFNQLVDQYATLDEVWYHEEDPKRIKVLKGSKAASSWGSSEIGQTGWVQLVQGSPNHKGGKTLIIVTTKEQYTNVT